MTDLGYQILAISPDTPENLRASIEKHDLEFELFSDSDLKVARAFGLAYKVDEKTVRAYKGYGIDLVSASGGAHYMLPVPAVFVLTTDQLINFKYVNPNHRIRCDPDVLIAAAKAALK